MLPIDPAVQEAIKVAVQQTTSNLNSFTQWLPTLISTGVLGLVWNDLRKFKGVMTKFLFREDGESIYMPRNVCEKEQFRCQTLTCGKIEALGVKMDLMDSKREHAKNNHDLQIGNILQSLAVQNSTIEVLSDDIAELKKDFKAVHEKK